MRRALRQKGDARRKLQDSHEDKDPRHHAQKDEAYNIDDFAKMLYGEAARGELSHLQLAPGKFLNSIAKGAGYFLDQVSDITSGPFPTTNNAGNMNAFIAPLQQQVGSLKSPEPVVLQTPEMLQARNAQLTLSPPPPQMLPNVMVPQLVPQMVQPSMAAAVVPPVGAPVPMGGDPAAAAVAGQVAAAVPVAPAFVHTQVTTPEERAQVVSQNINDTLAKAYTTSRIPPRVINGVRFEYIAGVIVIIMVVIFFIAGCVYRIRQKRRKKKNTS